MTVYTAAVYVIITLGTRQPIIEQCSAGVGQKCMHAQLCTAACLEIEVGRCFACFVSFMYYG